MANALIDQFTMDNNQADLDLSEYELVKEHDFTRYYQVTEQNSKVIFNVDFYFYGGIISGWSVKPEDASYKNFRDAQGS